VIPPHGVGSPPLFLVNADGPSPGSRSLSSMRLEYQGPIESLRLPGDITMLRPKFVFSVSISKYKSSDLPELPGAAIDADNFSDALDRPGFCQIREPVSLSNKQAIKEHILDTELLKSRVHRADQFIFYFNGHGWCEEDAATGVAKYYLLPSDVKCTTDSSGTLRVDLKTAISEEELWGFVGELNASEIVLILDCCHGGGTFGAGIKFEQHLEDWVKGRKSIFAMASVRGHQFAIETDEGGLFTSELCKAMRGYGVKPDGQGMLTAMEAFVCAKRKAVERAQGLLINESLVKLRKDYGFQSSLVRQGLTPVQVEEAIRKEALERVKGGSPRQVASSLEMNGPVYLGRLVKRPPPWIVPRWVFFLVVCLLLSLSAAAWWYFSPVLPGIPERPEPPIGSGPGPARPESPKGTESLDNSVFLPIPKAQNLKPRSIKGLIQQKGSDHVLDIAHLNPNPHGYMGDIGDIGPFQDTSQPGSWGYEVDFQGRGPNKSNTQYRLITGSEKNGKLNKDVQNKPIRANQVGSVVLVKGGWWWASPDSGIDLSELNPTHIAWDVELKDLDPRDSSVRVYFFIGTMDDWFWDPDPKDPERAEKKKFLYPASLQRHDIWNEELKAGSTQLKRPLSMVKPEEFAYVVGLFGWTVSAPSETSPAAKKFKLKITNVRYIHEK
jgi:Caspase domain